MSLWIMLVFIVVLNVSAFLICKSNPVRWFASSLIVMLLLSPIVLFASARWIGEASGDGIAVAAAGFVYAIATFVNGLFFLFAGLYHKYNL
ncbi:hypothetical protein P6709_11355 [Jeotgalibacillus sp. ET6]|uniref:hypothetical protein n=1 Tax=Jeotgalibacillus sp. ET6 TaxID=3037260 RepID=UPI00241840D6|nr:hypothetical protein [Jeotgalibacillus sp. ET6]MDG5472352.1 hypothetical protein [Jeotgalibacillus sp. ET6]